MIKERNKFLLSILIIFALFFVYFKINENVLKKELEKSSKFTIGTIKKIYETGKGDTNVHVVFSYKKKKISITVFLGIEIKDSHKVKDRIFIQFSPKHPDEYFLCLDVPKVPHDLNAPENGWNHLPVKKQPLSWHELLNRSLYYSVQYATNNLNQQKFYFALNIGFGNKLINQLSLRALGQRIKKSITYIIIQKKKVLQLIQLIGNTVMLGIIPEIKRNWKQT